MEEKNKKIRVLIVDDSFFMRKLLLDILSSDAEIEVVGEAKDGVEAVLAAARLKPDVITMDYLMPKMNGRDSIEKIMQGAEPVPRIIMLSAHAEEGAETTLQCLAAGCVDFVLKPSGELSLDIEKIKKEIISKVKMAANARFRFFGKTNRQVKKKVAIEKHALKVVAIGASTGGPPILEQIISSLSADLDMAVLVVQHMPAYFTKTFAERLDKITHFSVKEAEEGDVVKVGMVFVAPGEFHMELEKKSEEENSGVVIHLTKTPPKNEFRPSIDVLMASAVRCYRNKIVGVILTGMGSDGLEGMRAVKNARGCTIVQNPETAVVDSMPKSVIDGGLADEILPPDKIAEKIAELSSEKL